MAGHYHGHVDALLQAGSAATTLGTPNSPGVTAGRRRHGPLPFNDLKAVAGTFAAPGRDRLCDHEAAPGQHRHGAPAAPLRPGPEGSVSQGNGALSVSDKVMTSYPPASARLEFVRMMAYVRSDDLGKVIGGGFPAAAFSGRAT